MDAGFQILVARRSAGLSQHELAGRAGTSQATISAYESGRKQPSVATLARLLAASGRRLAVKPAEVPVIHLTEDRLERAGHGLARVLELAEALPTEHHATTRFPRLHARVSRRGS